jgi:CHASE2 domain-containing sensor protein
VLSFIKRIVWLGLVSGLLCGAAAWLLVRILMVSGLEEWLQDGRFFGRGLWQTQTKIIVIGLDEDSLEKLPGGLICVSPQLAEVVTYLSDRKAAAIGLDLLLPEEKFGMEELLEGGKGDATKLGAAIAEAGNVVLAEMKLPKGWRKPLPQWRWKELRDPDPSRIDLGFVNVTEDDDNVARRQQLGADGHTHFALALYARARQAEVVWADGGLSVGGRHVPLDAEGKLLINFAGPPGTFAPIPFHEVLSAARNLRSAPADFGGAIVIIGVTDPAQGDLHATPWANRYWRRVSSGDGSLMPGPELHANIIATIGDGAFIHPVSWLTSLPLLLVIGGVLGIALEELNRARRNLWLLLGGPPLLFLFCFTWSYAGSEAFARANLRIETVPVFLTAILAYVGSLALQRISRAKRRRSGAMKIFVSYRRDDSRHVTERIYGRLAARFGKENVFKDVDSIAPGQDFRPVLEAAVAQCAAMVAIIGPRWLIITDDAGQRRLDSAGDYVRFELERALARNIQVIPVLVDGAAPLKAIELPTSLQPLAFRQATPVRPDPDFRNDMERLLTALSNAKSFSPEPTATTGSTPSAPSPLAPG